MLLNSFDVTIDEDEEVANALLEAQEAFEKFESPAWFEWGGRYLMPRAEARYVEEQRRIEEAKQIRFEQDESERIRCEEEEERMERKERKEILEWGLAQARAALAEQGARLRVSEMDREGNEESESEIAALVGGSEASKAKGKMRAAGSKRKRAESGGRCDRCASFKSPATCIVDEGAQKCRKCLEDRQACRWGGKAVDGTEKRVQQRKKSAKLRETGKSVSKFSKLR